MSTLAQRLKEKSQNVNVAKSEDVIQTGFVKPTGLYPAKIKMAFTKESKNGAVGIDLEFDLGKSHGSYKETLWIVGTKGNFTYKDKNSGEEHFIPGMQHYADLSKLVAGKDYTEMVEETKMVNTWDYDTKKELPTEQQVLTDLLGKDCYIGLIKIKENKNALAADGKYKPTAEERELNTINKVFNIDGFTAAEVESGASEPEFGLKWADTYNEDYVRDNRKIKTGGGGKATTTTKRTNKFAAK